MSSGKIKKIKIFFEDADCVFFVVLLENIRIAGARAHFMRYIFFSVHFNSIHFNSIHFYSAWRKKRNVTNDNEKNEWKRKLRKLRNITKKRKNVVKKITLSWYFMLKLYTFLYMLRMSLLHFFLFSVSFSFFRSFFFFSLISFLFVIYELQFFLLNKIVIVRKCFFFIITKN